MELLRRADERRRSDREAEEAEEEEEEEEEEVEEVDARFLRALFFEEGVLPSAVDVVAMVARSRVLRHFKSFRQGLLCVVAVVVVVAAAGAVVSGSDALNFVIFSVDVVLATSSGGERNAEVWRWQWRWLALE